MNSHPLTPKQFEAVCHLLEAPSVAEAARRAGVARSTLYEWLKQPAFSRELAQARQAEHQARLNALTELLPVALKTLSKLLGSYNHGVALKAACEIVKACQVLADKEPPEAALAPLSEDGAMELDGNLTELTRQSMRQLLNGTLEPRAAQMLPSYLRLLERLNKPASDSGARGAEEEENMLERGWSQHEVESLLEESRSRYSSGADGEER